LRHRLKASSPKSIIRDFRQLQDKKRKNSQKVKQKIRDRARTRRMIPRQQKSVEKTKNFLKKKRRRI